MEVHPASLSITGGSALLTVTAGPPHVQDFSLQASRPLPNSITITSPLGSQAGGNPLLYWDDPFQITLPPLTAAPAHATPNSSIVTIVDVSLSSGATPVIGSSLTYLTLYDGSGDAVGTQAIARTIPGAAVGGFDFTFGGLAIASGAGGAGSSALGSATQIVAQSSGLHRQAHGTLGLTIQSVRVAATTRPSTAARGSAGDRPPTAAAADTGPDSDACRQARYKLDHYIYLEGLEASNTEVFFGNPEVLALLDAVDTACAPEPPPLPPCGTVAYPCDPGNDNIFDIPVPVDPSGFVMTRTGIPLQHARVVLQRSDAKTGPFSALPNGSVEMSASNRRNPDFTDVNGHFGWDVFPGYYRVAASRHGCRGMALSPSSPVPPPVTNLRLRLNCPGLHRARTVTRILSAKLRGPDTIVTLIVVRRGRRGARPTGLIALEVNGKPRGFAFINPRTGRATTLMFGHLRRGTRITAGYAGNARFAPSSARARR
jgi:hypothetical protein